MIEGIVLAAGLGTRLGRVKSLVLVDGRPALAQILDRLTRCGLTRPIVVLGWQSEAVRHAVDLRGCRVVENEAPSLGLASSLRLGLQAISPGAQGALILHADMPFVREATIRAVLAAARTGASIAAPYDHGRRGFPVFVRRVHIPAIIESLTGDAGAREYLATHNDAMTRVDVDDPGCVLDIDRPEDLAAAEGRPRCSTSG